MATVEFTINMNCSVERDEDVDGFVSHCPTLDVYSQGETEEEALEAIKSAVTMHITTAFDFNRLEKVLRKAGFERFSKPGQRPGPVLGDAEYVSVAVTPDPKMKQVRISLPMHLLDQPSPQHASVA